MKLQFKILALTIGIATIAILSASWFGYRFAVEETRRGIDAYLEAEAGAVVCELDGWIFSKSRTIANLASVIKVQGDPSQVSAQLLQSLANDPDISDIYMGFEDGRFISAIGWVPPEGYDPRNRPWYRQAVEAGSLNFSDPYLDMTTGQYAVSIGIPVRDHTGALVGVLAEDLLLETLKERVSSITLNGRGYGFLVDRKGFALTHPDPTYINTDLSVNPETREIFRYIQHFRNGKQDYVLKGLSKVMVFRTLESTGWYLGVAVDKASVYGAVEKLGRQYLMLAAAILAGVLVAGLRFSEHLSSRVKRMAERSLQLAEGNFDTGEPLGGHDEVSELDHAFRTMSDKLRLLIAERDDALLHLGMVNDDLERKVEERTMEVTAANQELTAINQELLATVELLQQTRRQLVQAEKQAALGTTVSGMAHELNTPVGIAVTGISYVERRLGELHTLFQEGRLHRSELQQFFSDSEEMIETISRSLNRTDQVIRSFKMVSLDETSRESGAFDLREHLETVVQSLDPIVRTDHHLVLECPAGIRVEGYAGAYTQIVTQCVTNSLQHAFAPGEKGQMTLRVETEPMELRMVYEDDGAGMPQEVADRIFEPFYTTKRGKAGGIGLGMFLVYNAVVNILGGDIECHSAPGAGMRIEIRLPRRTVMG